MKKAYILHGCCDEEEYFSDEYPSPSNFHWIPWLQKQLLKQGYFCQTPEMPFDTQDRYSAWKNTLELFPIDNDTSLIGHSCGAGFLLKWLSQNQVQIDTLALVAPWLDPKKQYGDFLSCTLPTDLAKRVNKIHIFYSSDEFVSGVKGSVDLITSTYPNTQLHNFDNMGHFCLGDMGTDQFPELLSALS